LQQIKTSLRKGEKRMKKKWTLQIVLMLVLGMALVGCGKAPATSDSAASSTDAPSTVAPSAAQTAAPAADDNEQITLKMLHYAPFSKTILDKFHEKYPNITIQFEQVDSKDYNTVVLSRLAAKADIDLVGLHPSLSEFTEAAKSGALIDITDSPYLTNVNPVAVGQGTFDSKVYGYAQGAYVVGAWYNKDIFAKAGITALPTNWDEFIADSELIKKTGVAPFVIAGKDSWTLTYFFSLQLAMLESQNPGTMKKLTTGEVKWTDPQMVSTLSKIEELSKKGYILKGALGTSYDQAVQAFQAGQAAMWLMGDWALDKFAADFNKFNVGAMAAPFMDEGQKFQTPLVTDIVLSGISWSKHQDAVKKFLEFAAQPENAKLQSTDQKIFSTVKDGTADFHPLAKEWVPLYDTGTPDVSGQMTAGVSAEIISQMQGILTGKTAATAATALQKVQETDNKTAK
jgi:raffinose/stachyose/melibiose transport system substrate-binding protein